MKHSISTTALLIALFLAAQLIGLALVYQNIASIEIIDGKPIVQHDTTAIGDRPDLEGGQSFTFIVIGVAIGTLLVLALIRYSLFGLWKLWFFGAVALALYVAFGVILPLWLAFIFAMSLAAWKILKPNPIIHNLTELFIYAGIAVLIAPLFDLLWISLLLVAISLYDIYAVWKSKHMVHMAQAQTKANLFAGLAVPKGTRAVHKATKTSKKQVLPAPARPGAQDGGVAILGGGDVAFPLLFSSVVLTWLIERGTAPTSALYQSLIITACVTLSIALLFVYAKRGKFYPAMPVVSAGCFAGLTIIALL